MHDFNYKNYKKTINQKILFSIITVVRNDYHRLLITINSLSNFYRDSSFEHIIVDCKSTDKTKDLLHEVKVKKNIIIVSEKDNGIYDAMNKGINLASGRYLLFLNAGDSLMADNQQLHHWIELLESRIKVSIACFPALMQNGDDFFPLIPRPPALYKMPTSHQAMLFSADFLSNYSYNAQLKIAGDFDLYLRALREDIYVLRSENYLTKIELVGYASKNPLLAYKEYLFSAFKRLYGLERIITLLGILSWGCLVILVKNALPAKIVQCLRSLK
jgi:putative colanic acid biosynthesis glycosyltransferase